MGIGPVLELPDDLADSMRSALAEKGVRTQGSNGRLTFRLGLAAIHGSLADHEGRHLLWLTSPKLHAFITVFWPFDLFLTDRIQRTLIQHGALCVEWQPVFPK